ncbi:sensor histidine kinase [Kibdelosporangium phytohabitans]|uniref:histidine kinase n=1 Tax=Kibdelosporangium phytohabitans TaxID=860235 RepID=A0A0N9I8R9_9PSEU|nr:sensor histidine kinase [Kibdelosporangium phytohabitans]ALG12331.1 histidine kinase [Kibdelosporangium phytohabitans]MBE1463892.1 sensor histidine kinase regulating citrate/malate metabolism [Kibdelosporangium phytohabitans]
MREWSLARQLLVLQVVIVAVIVGGGSILAYLDAARNTEDTARREVVAVAKSVADAPTLVNALATPNPSTTLQPFAEAVRHDTGVDFITIMKTDGTRYTHPNPQEIGRQFLGNTRDALEGRVLTETFVGTLGPSVRAVVPVFSADRVVAMVAVGITVAAIADELSSRLVAVVLVAAAALGVGLIGTYFVSARVRRQTRRMGPAALGRMIDYHESILHAVHEGLLLLDRNGVVTLCNDAGRELLGVAEDVEGKPLSSLGLPSSLVDSLVSGGPVRDEIHVTDRSVLVVNKSEVPAHGAVVTFRDHTDLQALTGELDSVKGFAESLRSQAHEAANRLHTVVSLIELDRTGEAVRFATEELQIAQQLTDRVVGSVREPVLAALLLGKMAEASERGVELVITPDTHIEETALPGRDLVTILGNLIDNAFDAAIEGDEAPKVHVTVRSADPGVLIRVADTGPGLDEDASRAAFTRGWSTKDSSRGLGLALVGQAVRRYGGTIELGQEIGAVFTVRLPAGGQPEPAPHPRDGR